MMKKKLLFTIFVLSVFAIQAQKQVYIPKTFNTDNPFKTEWSYERSYQSDNFVCFWGAKEDTVPKTFDPAFICNTLEQVYTKYVTELGFCHDGPETNLGKYKCIIVMNNTWGNGGPTGWAFGGSYDDVIGAMWVDAGACNDGATISHEFAHSLQSMNYIQENTTGGGFVGYQPTGFVWEVHANFMRAQIYPQYAFSDFPRWLATRMFHWGSIRHYYTCQGLFYRIQEADSFGMVTNLWRYSIDKEHPLETYKRLKNWEQSELNNFVYDYAKREVTFDYNINNWGYYFRKQVANIKKNEPHYLWRYHTILNCIDSAKGRYIVPNTIAPGDYGLNIVPLHYDTTVNCTQRTVYVKFKGHTEVNDCAGWRYGFVAVKNDSVARYSPTYANNDAEISFTLENNETELYMVIVGAPTTHHTYNWEPGWPKEYRYPYELCIRNAKPEGYQNNFRQWLKTDGAPHPNGGGWVAGTASVASTVYVGPKAIVLGKARITGNACVSGFAIVDGTTVKDNAVIDGFANVWGGAVNGDAHVSDHAVLSNCTVRENAIVKGAALEWGVILKGTVVVAGDAEIGSCANGVYLQTPNSNNGRTECDGKDHTHKSNIDINNIYYPFFDAQMQFADSVVCGNSCYTLPSNGELYAVKSKLNNLFLTVDNAAVSNGSLVSSKSYTDSAHQKFTFNKLDNSFSLLPLHANSMALQYLLNNNTGNTNVVINPANQTDAGQQWLFIPDSNGYYNIVSQNNGLYLTATLSGQITGNQVQQVSATTTDAQKYQLIKVLPTTQILNAVVDTFNNPGPQVNVINQLANGAQLSIWPNPAINKVNISINGFDNGQNVTLSFFDLNGRLVSKKVVGNNSQYSYSTNELKKYGSIIIVRAVSANKVVTQRLVLIN